MVISKYPEHVEKMVIAGGIRINNGMNNRFVWKWFGGALYSTALGFPPADPAAADAWFTQNTEKDNPNRLFDKTNAAILEDTGAVSFAPWREISFSLVGADYKTELSQLNVPTIFIYGTADSQYTGKPVADELCSSLLNCQSAAFTQSGHWAFLEESDKFQQVLKDFLNNSSSFADLGVWPAAAVIKVDDSAAGLQEGLPAGCWTVGVAISGHANGLDLAEWSALSPKKQRKHRERATADLEAAGAHYVIDSVADLMPVVEKIDRRIANGETP